MNDEFAHPYDRQNQIRDLVGFAMRRRKRTLKAMSKKQRQKWLVLCSDQTVFINTEFQAMKQARQHGKPIVEMLKTSARILPQTNGLSKLLESLEVKKNV